MQFKTFDILPHGTKFDFVGKRHTCLVDQAKNLVSFDGGKAVPMPGTADAKKK